MAKRLTSLSLEEKLYNNRFFPRAKGFTYPASSNGHCPLSPCGAHWWKIQSADGPVSVGVCKYCGEEREFLNNFELGFKR